MVKAFYPGTFDPVTNGHTDIVKRAAAIFSQLTVGVYANPPKRLMFDVHERVDLFSRAVSDVPNVDVIPYHRLTVDEAHEIGAQVIVRGLRLGSDFEYESEMALMNRAVGSDVETVCLFSSIEYQFISSSRIKEIAMLQGDVSKFVPQHVLEPLLNRVRSPGTQRA